jgi:hypothetical protein
MTSRGACAAILLVATCDAWAGRPLSVEDASVVEEHGCQVEAWVDRSRDATTGWMVPACNFFWDTEWQAGFARAHEERTRFSDAYLQAKTLLREATADSPWSAASAFGVTRKRLDQTHRGDDNPYAIAVLTVQAGSAPVLLHGNLGWSRDRETSRDATVWGVAAESQVSASTALMGEVFGENSQRPFWRAGARWTVIPKRLDLDLSYVARPGGTGAERFISLGVTWQSGRLAP